jgi:hypothetical protein
MDTPSTIDEVSHASARVIYTISSIFPLDITPDHLVIDENKVTIELRQPLGVQETHTLLIDDIQDVDLDEEVLYGTLRLMPKATGADWISISNLKKAEASIARDVIAGLMLAKEHEVDLAAIPNDQLCNQVIACGKTY